MLTTAEVTRVLACYGLGEPVQIRQAGCGSGNETVYVDTSSGRFVVRRNDWRAGEATLRYRQALVARLRERCFPAPAILPTRDGDTLLTLERRFYEVHAFIAGSCFNHERPRQLLSVGATLARYHQAVDGFPAPPRSAPPRYTGQAVLALCERLVERDVMGELADQLEWYSERAAQLQCGAGGPGRQLPALVIHGDVHEANLRFANDAAVALIDYDQASWDARAVDLADALVAFAACPDGTQGWGVYRGPLDPRRSARLLAAYAALAPLEPAEVAALPLLVEALWLQGALCRVRDTPEADEAYHCAVLAQGQELSRWVQDAAPLLEARWAAAGIGCGAVAG